MAAFRLPNQTNRLALIMDPLTDRVPFTFGIEIFERGHKTTPHVHPTSQELFFILAGRPVLCHHFTQSAQKVSALRSEGQVIVCPPLGHDMCTVNHQRVHMLHLAVSLLHMHVR